MGRAAPSGGAKAPVVEDSVLLADALALSLETCGMQVVGPVADLPGALRLAEAAEFDCALLDVNLCGVPVFPLCAILQRRAIPFLLLTGYSSAAIPSEFRAAPYLSKPCDEAELECTLRGLLAPSPMTVRATPDVLSIPMPR